MADEKRIIPDYESARRPTERKPPPPPERPCVVCRNTTYEWGRLNHLAFQPMQHPSTPDDDGWTRVWARRCRKCNNVQLFALSTEDE